MVTKNYVPGFASYGNPLGHVIIIHILVYLLYHTHAHTHTLTHRQCIMCTYNTDLVLTVQASKILKVYPPFVNFFEVSKETLHRCDKQYPRFHAFLKVSNYIICVHLCTHMCMNVRASATCVIICCEYYGTHNQLYLQ